MEYISPKALEKSFTCPHCGTIAMQEWWRKTWEGFNALLRMI